jgi:hypothetical protein
VLLERMFDYTRAMVTPKDHEKSRCVERCRRGRCQLYVNHDGHDHAVMIYTGGAVYSRGTGKTRARQVIRWDDDGQEWIDPGDKWGAAATGRPPWHSMGLG